MNTSHLGKKSLRNDKSTTKELRKTDYYYYKIPLEVQLDSELDYSDYPNLEYDSDSWMSLGPPATENCTYRCNKTKYGQNSGLSRRDKNNLRANSRITFIMETSKVLVTNNGVRRKTSSRPIVKPLSSFDDTRKQKVSRNTNIRRHCHKKSEKYPNVEVKTEKSEDRLPQSSSKNFGEYFCYPDTCEYIKQKPAGTTVSTTAGTTCKPTTCDRTSHRSKIKISDKIITPITKNAEDDKAKRPSPKLNEEEYKDKSGTENRPSAPKKCKITKSREGRLRPVEKMMDDEIPVKLLYASTEVGLDVIDHDPSKLLRAAPCASAPLKEKDTKNIARPKEPYENCLGCSKQAPATMEKRKIKKHKPPTKSKGCKEASSKRKPDSCEPSNKLLQSKSKTTRKVSKKSINLDDYEPVTHPTYCNMKPNCVERNKNLIYTGLLRKKKPPKGSEVALTTDETAASLLGEEPNEKRDLSVMDRSLIYPIHPPPKVSKPKIGVELPIGIIHEIQNKNGATVGYLEIMPDGTIEIRPRRTGKNYDNEIIYINALPDGSYEIELEAAEGDSLSNKSYDSTIDYMKSLPPGIYRLKPPIEILPLGTYIMKTKKGASVGYVESLPNETIELRPRRTGKIYYNIVKHIKSLPDDTFAINLEEPEGDSLSKPTTDSTVDYMKSFPTGIYILHPITRQASVETIGRVPPGSCKVRCGSPNEIKGLLPEEPSIKSTDVRSLKSAYEVISKLPIGTYELRKSNAKVGYLESFPGGLIQLRPRIFGELYKNRIDSIRKHLSRDTYEIELLIPDGGDSYNGQSNYIKSFSAGIYELLRISDEVSYSLPKGIYEIRKAKVVVGYAESLPDGSVELRPKAYGEKYKNRIEQIKALTTGDIEIKLEEADDDLSSRKTCKCRVDYVQKLPAGIYELHSIGAQLPIGMYELLSNGNKVGYVDCLPNGLVEIRPRRTGKKYDNKIGYTKWLPDRTYEIRLENADEDISSIIQKYDSVTDFFKGLPIGIYRLRPLPSQVTMDSKAVSAKFTPDITGVDNESQKRAISCNIKCEESATDYIRHVKPESAELKYLEKPCHRSCSETSEPSNNISMQYKHISYENDKPKESARNVDEIFSDRITLEEFEKSEMSKTTSIQSDQNKITPPSEVSEYNSVGGRITDSQTSECESMKDKMVQTSVCRSNSLGKRQGSTLKNIAEFVQYFSLPQGLYELVQREGKLGYAESLPDGSIELRSKRYGHKYTNRISELRPLPAGDYEIELHVVEDKTENSLESLPTGIYELHPLGDVLPIGTYELLYKDIQTGYVQCSSDGIVQIRPRRRGKIYDNRIGYTRALFNGMYNVKIEALDADYLSFGTYDSINDYMKSLPVGTYQLRPIFSEKDSDESEKSRSSKESADDKYETRIFRSYIESDRTSKCSDDAKKLEPTVLDLDETVFLETKADATEQYGEPSFKTTFVIEDGEATDCKKVSSLSNGRYFANSGGGKLETLSEFIDDVIDSAISFVNKYKRPETLNTGSTAHNRCPDPNVYHKCCECPEPKKVIDQYDFYEKQYSNFTIEDKEDPKDERYSVARTKSMKGRVEEAQQYPCITTTEYMSNPILLKGDVDEEFNTSNRANCYCKEISCKCKFNCSGRYQVHKEATSDNNKYSNGKNNESLIKISDALSKNEFDSEFSFIPDKKRSFEKTISDYMF